MKRILYWLGIVEIVWTEDHDGEVRLRCVHALNGKKYVYGICGPSFRTDNPPYELRPDGTTHNGTSSGGYVERWYPYAEKPARPRLALFPKR